MTSIINKQEKLNGISFKVREIKEETISNEKTKNTEDKTESDINKKIPNLNDIQKKK